MNYIGVDVSKRKLDICLFNGESYSHLSIRNNEKSIKEYLKRVSKKESHFGMEATGSYHLVLLYVLQKMKYKVSVINPLIIKRFAQMRMMRAKTDKVDSKIIAGYLYSEKPELFVAKTKLQQQMIQILRAMEDITISIEGYKRRIESLTIDPNCSQFTLRSIKRIIEHMKRERDKLEKKLSEIVSKNYPQDYERLLSIKGLGKKTATVILSFFGGFENFENSKKVISYIGTNPSPVQSGTSIRGRGSISKQGNKYLRKMIFMTSLSAMQHNKSCVNLKKRLKERGKEHKIIRIAVANKVMRQAYAILKYKREYCENYISKNPALSAQA